MRWDGFAEEREALLVLYKAVLCSFWFFCSFLFWLRDSGYDETRLDGNVCLKRKDVYFGIYTWAMGGGVNAERVAERSERGGKKVKRDAMTAEK